MQIHDRSIVSRRAVLRGLGAALSLPLLDVIQATEARVAPAGSAGGSARADAPPTRAVWLYFPNGVADGAWDPARVGPRGELLELGEWMSPLEEHRDDLLLLRRVWTPDGNGHAAGTATWLTGADYDRERIHAGGVSVDQYAARAMRGKTLLPSLELSVEGEGFFANDLARNNVSWVEADRPASRECVPRTVFDRMFRKPGEGFADESVIDLVLSQARSLRGRVGREDRRKLDEYFEAVRSVERRLEFADRQAERAEKEGLLTESLIRPAPGIPTEHEEYVRLMLELVALAFWADATRVATFMLDHGQSNRYFNFIDGVRGTWHALSHWRDASGRTEDDDGMTSWDSVESKRAMYNEVTRWHHRQVAWFLERLKSIPEGDGTLLDHTMVVYGSSLADGHEHSAENLPLLIAGRGGGAVKTGRVLRPARETDFASVHLAALHGLGLEVDRFGEAREPLAGLRG